VTRERTEKKVSCGSNLDYRRGGSFLRSLEVIISIREYKQFFARVSDRSHYCDKARNIIPGNDDPCFNCGWKSYDVCFFL